MSAPTYRFSAPLWEWGGRASWFFVTVPEAASDEIDEITTLTAGGFLSWYLGLVVIVPLIGHATWHAYREVVTPPPPSIRTPY